MSAGDDLPRRLWSPLRGQELLPGMPEPEVEPEPLTLDLWADES